MAQTHDIDGTTVNYISQATWQQPVIDRSLDLIEVHSRWQVHTWLSNVMTAAEWSTLIGKRGSLVSITTTDPDDPNDSNYVTYYNVLLRNVTYTQHDSLNFRGVRLEFLVPL